MFNRSHLIVVNLAISCVALNVTNARLNSTDHQYGTVVTVTCDPGYEHRYINEVALVQLGEVVYFSCREISIVCTLSGHWSINTTICQRKSNIYD